MKVVMVAWITGAEQYPEDVSSREQAVDDAPKKRSVTFALSGAASLPMPFDPY